MQTTSAVIYRTKVLTGTGTRVRIARPGETDAQIEKWRQKIALSGRASLVFPTQALMDTFLERRREVQKSLKQAFKLRRLYLAGELVRKPTYHTTH